MADSSFGVKKFNLVGSGTPKIESPNNINLNAINVAISTNATVGGTLDVGGNLTVGDDFNIYWDSSGSGSANIKTDKSISIDSGNGTASFTHDGAHKFGISFLGNISTDHLLPGADNTYDLGISAVNWRNLYLDGTANVGSLVASGTITGNLTGNADTATKVNIQETNTGTRQVVFSAQNGTGNQDLYIDTNDSHLSYDPNLGRLYTPNYTGGSGGTSGSGLHHLSSTTISRDGMTVGADQSADAPAYLSSNYIRLDAQTGNLKASGICTASHFYGNGSNITGISASVDGVSTNANFNQNGGTTTGLSASSTLVFGTTIGQKFGYNYYSGNQFVHLRTSNSSSYNYGTLKIRSDRGNTGGAQPIYGSDSGASIMMAQYDGDVLLCTQTGNFNIGEFTGSGASARSNTGWHFDVTGQAKCCVDQNSSNPNCKMWRHSDGDALTFIERGSFAWDVEVGSVEISTSAKTTTYNTTSDYRLKENVVNVTGALAKINQLRPVNFNMIGNSQKMDGFIAHEVQAIIPYAVKGNKDAVKTVQDGDESDDGSVEAAAKIAAAATKEVPEYQQLDYSKLVGLLTASVQELSAKNDALEARIAALES